MWSVLFGIAGWFVASFFAKPLLNFLNLRNKVHEEMILHTANIDTMTPPGLAYVEAVVSLRRLGAKVQAVNSTASGLLRWFLFIRGYDLPEAGHGLIGLSNSLHREDRFLAIHKNSIQMGLKLPRDFNDEQIARMENKSLRAPVLVR